MLEKPNLNTKNQIVIVELPDLSNANTTFLTAKLDALGITGTVKSNDGFADNDYLLLGDVGQKRSEILKVGAAVTLGTSITLGACVYDHPIGTKVTLVRYNQLSIYGSATDDDSSPTLIGGLENIDVENGRNVIEVATGDIASYYYARFYNENDTAYSSYSDSVPALGLGFRTRGEIKREFLSMYGLKKDNLLTDDWLNRAINRWQRELSKRYKRWTCLKETEIQDLAEDRQSYALPTDIQDYTNDSIVSIKIKGQPELTYVDNEIFNNLTFDHIGSAVKTEAVVTDTTLVLDDSSDFNQQNSNCYSLGNTIAYPLNTESTGTLSGIAAGTAITAFADAGSDTTTVTSASHGLSNGDTAYIQGTRNYDGKYTVSGVAGNDFDIEKTFVADDATGAVDSTNGAISKTLPVGTEVWQNRTQGQPVNFNIEPDTQKIRLFPIPDSTWDLKNMTVEYWEQFTPLDDDADITRFFQPDNAFTYLNYQLSKLRTESEQLVLSKKSEWEEDLEKMVDEDTDFVDVRMQPRNIYRQPY